jgi:hypothetical protein
MVLIVGRCREWLLVAAIQPEVMQPWGHASRIGMLNQYAAWLIRVWVDVWLANGSEEQLQGLLERYWVGLGVQGFAVACSGRPG